MSTWDGPSRTKADGNLKGLHNRKHIFWSVITAITILAGPSLAAMFGKKKKSDPPRSDVLVPLYVYPAPGAWEPLFTAIESHPTLKFTVVINPASGPGSDSGPDGNYTREIPRLNAHANVRTIGYVSTDYVGRDLDAILRDVNIYSSWADGSSRTRQNAGNGTGGDDEGNSSEESLGMQMQGVFLDETPAQYDAASAESLEAITACIRSASGFGSSPLIIHNPGAIPDARYMGLCDVSVVFEGTYSTFQIYGFSKRISSFHAAAQTARGAAAVIIHSLPPNLSDDDQFELVRKAKELAGSIFVTGLSVDYYASFWDGWEGFIDDMNDTSS